MSALRTASFGATLLAFWLMHAVAVAADSGPGLYSASRDNSGLVGGPVRYRDTMLIVVTDEGVAAIVFQEFDEKDEKLPDKRTEYRYRFLKDAESPEVSGTGSVFDNYTGSVSDKYTGKEDATVKAGPIRFGWSGGGHDRGWVYYRPEEMQMCLAMADRFEDSFVKVLGKKLPLEKLDLKRFLRKKN